MSEGEIDAAKKKRISGEGIWIYYANYGKAVEREADAMVRTSAEFKTITKNVNHPDFEGKKGNKYEGLVFDITTSSQSTIDSHVGRTRDKKKADNYKNVIITIYTRTVDNPTMITEMDKNTKP